MREIIKGVSFQEYNLTIIRIVSFLAFLGEDHKKKTSINKIAFYDFYLRYPELINLETGNNDFDTEYAYFHWEPNYKIYKVVLQELQSRKLVIYSDINYNYYISSLGKEFKNELNNSYMDKIEVANSYVSRNICKLSEKKISEDINKRLSKKRGEKL